MLDFFINFVILEPSAIFFPEKSVDMTSRAVNNTSERHLFCFSDCTILNRFLQFFVQFFLNFFNLIIRKGLSVHRQWLKFVLLITDQFFDV